MWRTMNELYGHPVRTIYLSKKVVQVRFYFRSEIQNSSLELRNCLSKFSKIGSLFFANVTLICLQLQNLVGEDLKPFIKVSIQNHLIFCRKGFGDFGGGGMRIFATSLEVC